MDYKPNYYSNRNAVDKSNRYKKKRIFWLNTSFNSDFVLIDNKIYEISWDIPPFEIYKNNRLKLLTYIRDSNQSKPIQIKLKLPLTQSRDIINTDKEAFPIIYTNHTGVEMMTYGSNPIIRLIPQQITRFTFRLDDNFNKLDYNYYFTSITNGSVFQIANGNLDDKYIVFNSSGSFVLDKNLICDIFMIGGGGEGGTNCGGGGGAGSAIIAINQTIPAGTYNITIGSGGAGAVGAGATGNTGGDTSIGSLFVAKGGGGGGGNGSISTTGGCSGGVGGNNNSTAPNPVATNIVNGISNIAPSITSTYAVLGNKGGNGVSWTGDYQTINGGGGGGIGAVGTNATTSAAGTGGDGIYQVTIGEITYNLKNYFSPNSSFGVNDGNGNFYIGGGGGSGGYGIGTDIAGGKGGGGIGRDDGNPTGGTNGTINTGSGGGGGGGNAYSNNGGDGGSGLVIIRFKEKRNEGITAEENLIQTTNNSITVNTDSKYVINYQNPVNIPKGTYETIFANGAITFKSKPDYNYPTTSKSPIVWYKFDGSQLLYDSSGNNNLINNNGVSIDTSIYTRGNSSALFNPSTSSYFTMPKLNYNTINTTNGISFSFWGRFKSTTGTYAAVFQFIGSGGHCLIYRDGGNNFAFYNEIVSPADVKYIATSGINNFDNTWRHYTWTISTTGIWNIYINGSATNNNFSGNVISSGLNADQSYVSSIGRRTDTNHNIDGNIDDFRIFDYVLSPVEVYDLYNGNTDRSYPILKDANNATINPTAWYKFDVSNTGLVVDASGNGYTLTNNNNILYNSSIFVKGNGSAYLSQTAEQSFSYSGLNFHNTSFTVSVWGYLTAVKAENWIFTTDAIGSTNRTLVIGVFSDRIRFAFYANDVDYIQTTSNDINKWVHYTFVYDTSIPTGNNRFIYKNGVQVAGDRSSALSSPNTSGLIGKWSAATGTTFTGYLDDLRVYNGRGLTATQVSELYNGRVSIYNPPAFLTGFELEDEDLFKENTISSYK